MTEAALLHFAEACTAAFVAGLWQGLLLVPLLLLVFRLLPGLRASLRFSIGLTAFALLTALPWMHTTSHTAALLPHAVRAPSALAVVVGSAWAMLSLWRLSRVVLELRRMRRLAAGSQPFQLAASSAEAALQDGLVLCTSPDVEAPCVVGFVRPRLLLPLWMPATLTHAELEQVLGHEIEHLRRRDHWVNLGIRVVLALLPLHPGLHWLDRRLSLDREVACDAGAVRSQASSLAYARCLADLAHRRARRMQLAMGAWGRSRSQLLRRIDLLLCPARPLSRSGNLLALCGCVAMLAIAFAGMGRVPSLVSFNAAEAPLSAEVGAVATPALVAMPRQVHALPAIAHMQPRLVEATHRSSHAAARPRIVRTLSREQRRAPRAVLTSAAEALAPQERTGTVPIATPRLQRIAAPDAMQLPRILYTLDTDSGAPVIALPMSDGWLIVQI